MNQKILDSYVEKLYNNQNIGAQIVQQNLYSKKDYYDILKVVIEVLRENKDKTVEEMKEILFLRSGILDIIKQIVYEERICTGFVFSYGYDNYKETIVIGNRQEVTLDDQNQLVPALEEMTYDTIFDLASVTKLFTSLSILKLVQMGIVNLSDKITKYAPQFQNLQDVTIYDLLAFQVPLVTDTRLDEAKDRGQAEDILYHIKINEFFNPNANPYTDMGAMVLKYVIEGASGSNFYSFIDENILRPLKMNDTHVVIPKKKLYRVVNTNLDAKIYEDERVIVTKEAVKGVAYDAKARIMGQPDGNLSGHAGLFASNADMMKLGKGILSGKIINNEYVVEMGKNRTGRLLMDNDKQKSVQFLGYLCYSKNPIRQESEVFHALSGQSFASAGWLGHKFIVDPINQLYAFLSSNKSHNRVTYVNPGIRPKVEITEKDKTLIKLPTGEIKYDSSRFAWSKGKIVNPALKLCLQYKMLEDILSYHLDEEKNIIRKF